MIHVTNISLLVFNIDMLPLPCARKEAEMIGKLLSVTPLIEDRATKQAKFDEISQWAPSLLNGDNAKFEFGNWPGSITPEEP